MAAQLPGGTEKARAGRATGAPRACRRGTHGDLVFCYPSLNPMGDRATAAGEHKLATGKAAAGGRLVQNWRDAHERALAYLDALSVPDVERTGLSLVAVPEASAGRWTPRGNPVAATLDEVRRRLTGDGGRQAFLRWRLVRELGAGAKAGLAAAPPLRRRPMGYEFVPRRGGAG